MRLFRKVCQVYTHRHLYRKESNFRVHKALLTLHKYDRELIHRRLSQKLRTILLHYIIYYENVLYNVYYIILNSTKIRRIRRRTNTVFRI